MSYYLLEVGRSVTQCGAPEKKEKIMAYNKSDLV